VKDFFNKNWEMYLKRSLKIDKSRLLSTDVYVNKCKPIVKLRKALKVRLAT